MISIYYIQITVCDIGGVWDCSAPYFSAPLHVFFAKRFQLHALSSRKKVEL